jgi:hypothetical protein
MALLALTACGGSDASTASPSSASPTPTPTPTPESVIWAGAVCEAGDNVKLAVGALGHNLSYDVSSSRSAIEQIDRQLRLQVLSVADAADRMGTAVKAVPVDFTAGTDLANTLAKSGADTKAAVSEVTARLDAAMAADNIVAGAAQAGAAVVAAKAAFEAGQAFVGAITDATSTTNAELRKAFDAAPQCQDS